MSDDPAEILCELNPQWQLGRSRHEWQLWHKDPRTGRFFMEVSLQCTRRGMLNVCRERGIHVSAAAEKVISGLPERLMPFDPDVEAGG